MKSSEIITEENIDEIAAKDFLKASYDGIDLFPCMPETLTETLAATMLNVSEPTIQRVENALQDYLKSLPKGSLSNKKSA
ncbi:MAG: hypothetical protein IJP90_09160 [Treponema sp.]|nr:hypothetical protein [Treponema sp.]